MRKLLAILKWVASHLEIKTRNLNTDPDGKPKPSVEVGIKVDF